MKKILQAAVGLLLIIALAAGCGSDASDSGTPITGSTFSSGTTASTGTATDSSTSDTKEAYRSIAYVTVPASENWRWIGTDGDAPVSAVDTRYITHINFAFGMIDAYSHEANGSPLMDGNVVSKEAYKDINGDGNYHYKATVNGWIEEMKASVSGGKYLHALVKLKEQKPSLKVLLSIGGWNSDGFCYMAQTPEGRAEFIESCIDLINEYKLDGIDLDWEFPTNGGWGEIASCDSCVKDAGELLTEFRAKLTETFANSPKLLTIASGSSQSWVDAESFKALDYMNVMCYDNAPGTGGNMAGLDLAKGYMKSHVKMVGDSAENRAKINLGVPFYNEGGPFLVPYYKGWDGHVDASAEIIEEKMDWVKAEGYGGAFYWAYSMDTFEQDVTDSNDPEIKILQRTLFEALNK